MSEQLRSTLGFPGRLASARRGVPCTRPVNSKSFELSVPAVICHEAEILGRPDVGGLQDSLVALVDGYFHRYYDVM